MRRWVPLFAVAVLALGLALAPRHIDSRAALSPDFVHFESGHVHPATLTPDGTRLLVVNTPNGRLAVFDVTGSHPVQVGDIPVGLEPVSVAAQSDGEAWVVNHLSDDVSIVNLSTRNVRRTLRVGDEPADVVFANGRAYVSVSQYDQVRVYDPGTLALSNRIQSMSEAQNRVSDFASATGSSSRMKWAQSQTSMVACGRETSVC